MHRPGELVAGRLVDPELLAVELLAEPDTHLTLSGGEPTEQPRGSARLLAAARALGRTTWVYTGRTLDDLLADGDPDVLSMLAHVDVLVDGPFDQNLAGGVGFRGSSNQRILRLTEAIPEADADGGRPGKIELRLGGDDDLTLTGIPEPGRLGKLRERLAVCSWTPATGA